MIKNEISIISLKISTSTNLTILLEKNNKEFVSSSCDVDIFSIFLFLNFFREKYILTLNFFSLFFK